MFKLIHSYLPVKYWEEPGVTWCLLLMNIINVILSADQSTVLLISFVQPQNLSSVDSKSQERYIWSCSTNENYYEYLNCIITNNIDTNYNGNTIQICFLKLKYFNDKYLYIPLVLHSIP